MSPELEAANVSNAQLARLVELANIGAGHASTAFAQLARTPILMDVPSVCSVDHETNGDASGGECWSDGVFFELEGCLGALVGILFEGPVVEEVVRRVLGDAEEPLLPESVEAVLMELGNIMVSCVASAIADTLGERLLPSIPMLAMDRAGEEFDELVAQRNRGATVRIESQFGDREGELRGLLILVPDADAF